MLTNDSDKFQITSLNVECCFAPCTFQVWLIDLLLHLSQQLLPSFVSVNLWYCNSDLNCSFDSFQWIYNFLQIFKFCFIFNCIFPFWFKQIMRQQDLDQWFGICSVKKRIDFNYICHFDTSSVTQIQLKFWDVFGLSCRVLMWPNIGYDQMGMMHDASS